jgi:hypothetical protein
MAETKKRSALEILTEGSRQNDGGLKLPRQQKNDEEMRIGDASIDRFLNSAGAKPMDNFSIYVISKGRPSNVSTIHALFPSKTRPAWIVGEGETAAYQAQGAERVFEGGGLCASRNLAIMLASNENKICVQMSDDISEVKVLHQLDAWKKPDDLSEANSLAKEIENLIVSPLSAARYIHQEMEGIGAKLGGVYPTGNSGQAMSCPPASRDLFIIGDFLVIDPESAPRFDLKMSLKEDYDFTAQHLLAYKVVARSNRVLIKAAHYTNSGGDAT